MVCNLVWAPPSTQHASAQARMTGRLDSPGGWSAAASSQCAREHKICRNTGQRVALRARTCVVRRTRTGASAAVSAGACGSGGSAPGLASLMRSLYTFTRVSPPQRAATSAVLYCARAPHRVGYGSCQRAGYGSWPLPARCASRSRQMRGGCDGAAVCSSHGSRAQSVCRGRAMGDGARQLQSAEQGRCGHCCPW
jgi:hypothetical protein